MTVSILGADSGIIDQYYTHIGDEAQERAINLISGHGSTLQQRNTQALEFLTSIGNKTPELTKLEEILRG